MARSLGELAKSLSKKDGGGRRLLLDTKGLGRPETFSDDETSFRRWSRTITSLSISRSFRLLFGLGRCCGLQNQNQFGYDEDLNEDGIMGLADTCDKLYRVLSSLTTCESEDLVVGCGNLDASGFEAWRRLNRRWAVTAGRKRNLLRLY